MRSPVLHDAALRFSRETRPLEERDTYGKAFLRVPNLWRKDEGARQFVLARRFAQAAGDATFHSGWMLHCALGDLVATEKNPLVWSRSSDH